MPLKILFEDNCIIVCVKPVGVASQSPGMPELLSEQTRTGSVFCVHRLDEAVGGVMVYAKNGKTAAKLSEAFAGNLVHKKYLAVVHGVPPQPEGVMRDLLFKDQKSNKSYVVKRMRRGVREAKLYYSRKAVFSDGSGGSAVSLVAIELRTGRSHQIRVQFSSRGMPLLGDGKYGSRVSRCSVALWSRSLELCHPCSGEKLLFACPPPDSYPWSLPWAADKPISL